MSFLSIFQLILRKKNKIPAYLSFDANIQNKRKNSIRQQKKCLINKKRRAFSKFFFLQVKIVESRPKKERKTSRLNMTEKSFKNSMQIHRTRQIYKEWEKGKNKVFHSRRCVYNIFSWIKKETAIRRCFRCLYTLSSISFPFVNTLPFSFH